MGTTGFEPDLPKPTRHAITAALIYRGLVPRFRVGELECTCLSLLGRTDPDRLSKPEACGVALQAAPTRLTVPILTILCVGAMTNCASRFRRALFLVLMLWVLTSGATSVQPAGDDASNAATLGVGVAGIAAGAFFRWMQVTSGQNDQQVEAMVATLQDEQITSVEDLGLITNTDMLHQLPLSLMVRASIKNALFKIPIKQLSLIKQLLSDESELAMHLHGLCVQVTLKSRTTPLICFHSSAAGSGWFASPT